MRAFYRTLRILSAVTLFFFSWTFLPLWQVAAYAAEKPSTRGRGDTETRGKNQGPATSGERFEKALESIRENVGKAEKRHERGEDDIAEREQIRTKRAEIESADSEFKKEFAATEKKLKDAKLPQEILNRHYEFVKHYEDNLKELKTNLDDVEKAKTKADRKAKIAKAKAHLEKIKTPSKHVPLDPNKLPHRMVKGKERVPRLKKEEFEKDFPRQKKPAGLRSAEFGVRNVVAAGFSLREKVQQKPVLLAYNSTIASDAPLNFTVDVTPHSALETPHWRNSLLDFAFSDLTPPSALATPNFMVAQATVDLPTAEDLAETPEIQFTPELRQIATLLENNPVQLYEFVRNNITYDPYYGSVKGTQGTLLLQNGNDFDQASVLLALLRVSGIPARYVYGTIEIPIEKVMKWLGGITDPKTVGLVLATNGVPAKLMISGGTIKSVQLEHAWIEAYIPYANYRGKINDPTAHKTWIPLDPSFKFIESSPDTIDLADAQQFDIDSYLSGYLQAVKPKTPAKDYLKNTIEFVAVNIQTKKFNDLLVSNVIVEKVLDLLPDTLPYPVKTVGSKFSTIPDNYQQRITLELTNSSNEPIMNLATSWAMVLHNRFTLTYVPATTADEQIIASYGDIYSTPSYLINIKPVLKVEGVTMAEGTSVPMASDLTCRMSFIWSDGTIDKAITNLLVAGAPYAIGLGSGYTTGRIVTNRTAKLSTAVNAGQTGEPIIGEYLNLFAVNYLQELDSSRMMIAKSMKTIDTNYAAELMVGVDLGVSALFGIAHAVDIRGILIDVDYNVATPVNMDGDQAKVRRFQILAGMTSSALEHTMFESIVGVEAVSTIKALEIANVQGIPVHKIDASNIATKLPILQVSSEVRTDIQNAVQSGKVVTVSERNIQLNSWNGVGYIVMDSMTGAGAYQISGGVSGGSLTRVISTLKSMIASGQIDAQQVKGLITNHMALVWFPRPVDGGYITADFNAIRDYGQHKALDIAIENWSQVKAVADGTVVAAQYQDLAGNYVKIDHGLGVETLYAHNCMMLTYVGQKVKEGDVIALSGNTGRVSSSLIDVHGPDFYTCSYSSGENWGSHLHFEIMINGENVNPQTFLGIIGQYF